MSVFGDYRPEATGSSEINNQVKTVNSVYALAAAIDAKDHYTYGHSRKVTDLAVAVAKELGLPSNKIETIRAAGLLHDVGKIGIPDTILMKEGELTDEEWQAIKRHPRSGIEIVREIAELNDCIQGILCHHERWDGTGYPLGLHGDGIPLEARILSIADSYDALTSARHYRTQLSSEEGIAELKGCAGTQFDPNLVDIFSRTFH